MYRTIFFITNAYEPELAHRLQTSKMRRRNSTSLDSCQHNDINIVTVSVARRRPTAPLKPRIPCVKQFTAFYALLKHVSPKGDYFTPKGHYFAHWCERRPFSLSVNGAQPRVLHACVKKNKFTMLYGNDCYIFTENFPQKFSPCMVKIAKQCLKFFLCALMLQSLLYPYGDFTILRGEIHNSI